MIKVEHTKTHRIVNSKNNFPNGQTIDYGTQVLVTDAELVLVECKPKEAKLLIHNTTLHLYIYKEEHKEFLWLEESKYYKPILISRTEKIEEGDWYYYNKLLIKCENIDLVNIVNVTKGKCFKILVLPEHFSPQQLQDIVDGKLKEGKCLVECEVDGKMINKTFPASVRDRYFIKLNPHITIYPVEEKMYTREEMIKNAFNFYYDMSNRMKVPFNLISENRTNAEEWFEQNVK